jgi:DNA polymerase-3 subunit delta'
MQFSNVIGQANTKAMLREMANSGRLPHALLFLGAQGSGKLALAMAFTQYILCASPSAEDSCGQCAHCRKASKLIHPDVHFSFPTIGSKATSENFLPQWRAAIEENPYQHINHWLQHIGAENKQGNITKEECVNIIRKLSLKSFESTHKVLIMWLPEFLGKEGNRLLKMIEEPPENTIFILVAEDQSLILNTILSRCQLISIQPLQDKEIIQALTERHNQGEADAQSIAFLANGNYNEARQLLNQRENNHARLFLEWMRACYRGNPIPMIEWVGEMANEGRENQKHFLTYALHFLREFTLLKVTGTAQVRLQNAELETATNMSSVLSLDQVEQLSILFSDCAYAVERNANPKVLFLDASIQMNRIMKNKLSGAYQGLKRANML